MGILLVPLVPAIAFGILALLLPVIHRKLRSGTTLAEKFFLLLIIAIFIILARYWIIFLRDGGIFL